MSNVEYDFEGRTVVVTGGSSGIGRAIATRFGEAGASVVVADVREEPKDVGESTPTHEVVRESGGRSAFVPTDVSVPDEVESVVEAAREFGGVDVMVNNAGVTAGDAFLDTDHEVLDALYEVNVRGMYVGVRAAARDMLDRDDPGCIVNTASISSNVAQFGQVPYDATKGAVRMLTRGAALELGERGVRVNAVAPGQIATEMSAGWTEAAKREESHLKPIPLGRAGSPEEVAGAALFLASDEASYVTGELLFVDGGWQIC